MAWGEGGGEVRVIGARIAIWCFCFGGGFCGCAFVDLSLCVFRV